jgi:hypothetical protein
MKKSEINLLATFAKHCERVLTRSRPSSTDSRTYNAYRLARFKELEKVKRIIDKLYENVDTENNASAG